MVATAVCALVFLSSLAVGTGDAMIRNSVRLFTGHIISGDLPKNLKKAQLQLEGVEGVVLRKEQSVWLSHQGEMAPVDLLGVNPEEEKTYTAIWKKTVQGRYLKPGEAAVYISRQVALKLNVNAGDSIDIALNPGSTVARWRVCGIYETGISYVDNALAFCPLEAFPGSGSKLAAAVFLKDGTDIHKILASYRKLPGSAEFKAWTDFMPDLKELIDLNYISMDIVMVLVFGIVSLGISCAFVIFILKNLREHGVMKAMGVLPAEVVFLIVTQVTTLSLLASLAGDGLGAGAVALFSRIGIDLTAFTSHNQYFAVSGIIYPRLTFYSLILPPLLAVLFGLFASVWPAVFVIRKKSADILRAI